MPDAPATSSAGSAPAGASSTPASPAAPAAKGNGAPKPAPARVANGQFGPKDGAVGVVAQEGQPPPEKEAPRRFKLPYKYRGQVKEFDGTEEELATQLQLAERDRAHLEEYRKKAGDYESREQLAKEKTDEYLRSIGVDPDEFAKQRLSKLVELESMSEDARRAHDAQAKAEELEKKLKEREENDKRLRLEALTLQSRRARMDRYGKALDSEGLGRTKENLWLMAEAEAMVADKQGRHDFTDAELAKEAIRMGRGFGQRWLAGQAAPALVEELGAALDDASAAPVLFAKCPKLAAALLQHSIAEYEKAAGQPVVQVRQEESPPSPERPRESPYIDEREFERRQKERRLARQR